MQTIISRFPDELPGVSEGEGFIEDEREFPLSQVFLTTFQRFVTDNVKALKRSACGSA